MKSYSENGKENQETKQNMQSFKKQILSADLWISSAAECLATFIFLFVSCLSLMFPESIGETKNAFSKEFLQESGNFLQINIGIALVYATLIQCFESVSGSHMNPAVTVAMVIAGHIGLVKAIVYMVAQSAGAFSAVAICFGLFSNSNEQMLTIPRINKQLSPLQGFGVEFLLTFVLAVTWLATLATSRGRLGSSSLPVGIAYLANSLWGAQLTGACTNPARALPPAVLAKDWTNLWVYVAGPFTGSFIGAILYTQVFTSSSSDRRRKKDVVSTDRKAEGESVQSDQFTSELDGLEAKSTTTFCAANKQILARPNRSGSNIDLNKSNICPQTSRVCHSVTKDTSYSVPNLNKIQDLAPTNHYLPQSSMLLSSGEATQIWQQAATSTAPNSTNATLARRSTKSPFRPNTTFGMVIESTDQNTKKKMPCNHKQTARSSHRSESVSEPFSECASFLHNDAEL